MQLSPAQNSHLFLMPKEKLILDRISQGDFTCFWQFWQLHQQYFYHCCKKWMGGNSTEAEEVLSQAMLKAWEKLPQYAHKITNLKAWLTRLLHNLCVDIQRQRKRQARLSQNIDDFTLKSAEIFNQEYDSPESALMERELLNYLNSAISQLAPRQREVFKLRYHHNLSYREIAQKLNISPDNVAKDLQKARESLQKRVKKYLSGSDTSALEEFSPQPPEREIPPIPAINIDYHITALCLPTHLPVWFH